MATLPTNVVKNLRNYSVMRNGSELRIGRVEERERERLARPVHQNNVADIPFGSRTRFSDANNSSNQCVRAEIFKNRLVNQCIFNF